MNRAEVKLFPSCICNLNKSQQNQLLVVQILSFLAVTGFTKADSHLTFCTLSPVDEKKLFANLIVCTNEMSKTDLFSNISFSLFCLWKLKLLFTCCLTC